LCSASTLPLVCGRPARMRVCLAFNRLTVLVKSRLNSLPLSESNRSSRQPASRRSLATRDATGELGGLLGARRAGCPLFADHKLHPGGGGGDVDRGELQIAPFVPFRRPTKKQSIPTSSGRALNIDVLLWAGIPRRLVGRHIACGERQACLARVLSPWRQSAFQTPLGETTMPPHFSRRSSEETRLGPRPGWAIEKARTCSSTIFDSWLGIFGRRRSRGRSISRPLRSTSLQA
jgi:hypothetical protein